MSKVRPEISAEHMRFLEDQASSRDALKDGGVWSVYDADDLPKDMRLWPGRDGYPGLAFRWRGYDGQELIQLRPDKPIRFPDGHEAKYVFRKDADMILNVHPWMDKQVDDPQVPLVIIEGTKQYLAAVSALGKDSPYALVGMPGCYGWRQHKKPLPDLGALCQVVSGRECLLTFDADFKTNPDVYDAAKKLCELLKLYGAASVKFVAVPVVNTGTDGLDDVLSSLLGAEAKRDALIGLFERADSKLPARRPTKTKVTPYTDQTGRVLVQKVVDGIFEEHVLALAPDGTIAIYDKGVYHLDHQGFEMTKVIGDLLDDNYTDRTRANVLSLVKAELGHQNLRLPTEPASPWLNLRNGMLDQSGPTLHPHSPDYFSTVQLPFDWDPEATCPTYEAWLEQVAGADQIELIEQVFAQMLYPQETPTKAAFTFGPSRSGKSTLLRIMTRIAGDDNTSAATLQELGKDRFATSDLFGKVLNVAADLSHKAVSDISIFKNLTGDDLVAAQFKGRDRFKFRNHALLAFSANEVPQVDETTAAYRERTAKLRFGNTFAGHEDPTIEARMGTELSGILRRLVAAGRKRRLSGGTWALENVEARAEFNASSDIVARWFTETKTVVTVVPGDGDDMKPVGFHSCLPAKHGTTKTHLKQDFETWCDLEGEDFRITLGRLTRALTGYDGVFEVLVGKNKQKMLNIINKPSEDSVDHTPSTTSSDSSDRSDSFEGELATSEGEVGGTDLHEGEDVPTHIDEVRASETAETATSVTTVIEADFDLLHQWVYNIIVEDPAKATETKIRERLGISSTEYHGARDHLIKIGAVARRKGRGFDLLADLKLVRDAYIPLDPDRAVVPAGSWAALFDGVAVRPCVDCGTTEHADVQMLPTCDACLIPYELENDE